MQSTEAKFSRSGQLHLALRRYSAAVRDMEQTVLLPSLLRDIPSDQVWDSPEAEETSRDLHGYYVMLKAIRNTMESGFIHKDEQILKNYKPLELFLDSDPEALFHYHLRGLFSVMSDLTKKTQCLTDKYMDVIGVSN